MLLPHAGSGSSCRIVLSLAALEKLLGAYRNDLARAANGCNVVPTSHSIAAKGETPGLPVYGGE
jgi:hypothetical protein